MSLTCLVALTSFSLSPARETPSQEPPYNLVPPDSARGTVLLEKVLQGMGGAAAVDEVRSLELRGASVRHVSAAAELRVSTTTFIELPDKYRHEIVTPAGSMASMLNGDLAFVLFGANALPMPPAEAAALKSTMSRHPILLLRSRGEPGYRPTRIGTATVKGRHVEMVTVRPDADATTLYIDPDRGLLLRATYAISLGDAPRQAVVDFGDYRRVGGLMYPFSSSGTLDGAPLFTSTLDTVTLNPTLDGALFVPPPPPSPAPLPAP